MKPSSMLAQNVIPKGVTDKAKVIIKNTNNHIFLTSLSIIDYTPNFRKTQYRNIAQNWIVKFGYSAY